MLELRLDDRFELPKIGADLFEHRPDDPAILFEQHSQEMHRLDLRIPRRRGQLLRAATASWALIVSLSKRKGMM